MRPLALLECAERLTCRELKDSGPPSRYFCDPHSPPCRGRLRSRTKSTTCGSASLRGRCLCPGRRSWADTGPVHRSSRGSSRSGVSARVLRAVCAPGGTERARAPLVEPRGPDGDARPRGGPPPAQAAAGPGRVEPAAIALRRAATPCRGRTGSGLCCRTRRLGIVRWP
jgi:hypothetical protein